MHFWPKTSNCHETGDGICAISASPAVTRLQQARWRRYVASDTGVDFAETANGKQQGSR